MLYYLSSSPHLVTMGAAATSHDESFCAHYLLLLDTPLRPARVDDIGTRCLALFSPIPAELALDTLFEPG